MPDKTTWAPGAGGESSGRVSAIFGRQSVRVSGNAQVAPSIPVHKGRPPIFSIVIVNGAEGEIEEAKEGIQQMG